MGFIKNLFHLFLQGSDNPYLMLICIFLNKRELAHPVGLEPTYSTYSIKDRLEGG